MNGQPISNPPGNHPHLPKLSLAEILCFGFVPEYSHGTLATTQPPVDITDVPIGILGSVKSCPLIAVGPNRGNTPPISNAPQGYKNGTAYFLARGIFHLRVIDVTVPGEITLDLQQMPLGTATFGSFNGSSGISKPAIYIAINPNQRDYFVPIEVANAGEPGNTTYGTFDVFVSRKGVTAASLQVIAGSLQVMIWPTNTEIASYPQILEFISTGQESKLLYK